jgi:hypothetical protein
VNEAIAGTDPDLTDVLAIDEALSRLESTDPRKAKILVESTDRRFVALSLAGGAVIVLDSTTGAQLATIRGDGTPVLRLAFDADGRLTIGKTGGRVERVSVVDLA